MPERDATGDDTTWLSNPEQEAWRAVVTLMLRLPGPLEQQLQRDSGMTLFEYLVLSFLSMADEHQLRMSELAELANSSLSRLSNVVARFESRGLVRRVPDPADARATMATLTPSGMETVVAAAPGHVTEVRRLLIDPLDADQLAALTEAVDRLRPLL